MKLSVVHYIGVTSLLLVVIIVMVGMRLPFSWIFAVTALGQCMVVYMVYKVLTDAYTTHKTFEDFYEDKDVKH